MGFQDLHVLDFNIRYLQKKEQCQLLKLAPNNRYQIFSVTCKFTTGARCCPFGYEYETVLVQADLLKVLTVKCDEFKGRLKIGQYKPVWSYRLVLIQTANVEPFVS